MSIFYNLHELIHERSTVVWRRPMRIVIQKFPQISFEVDLLIRPTVYECTLIYHSRMILVSDKGNII